MNPQAKDRPSTDERAPGSHLTPNPSRLTEPKLGICVVYLVDETDGPLLDLHLRYIQEHTTSLYTIYASVNRLLPQFRRVLEGRPEVQIVDIPTTDLRGAKEHAYYLEHLISAAVEEDCSHIAILHVDSFPIVQGWERKLAARLTAASPLAAIVENPKANRRPCTAGMLFTQDFHLHHQPRLMLSEDERSSRAYRRYALREPHCADSGVGYGLRLYTEGLQWHPLHAASPQGHRHRLGSGVRRPDLPPWRGGAEPDQQKSKPAWTA